MPGEEAEDVLWKEVVPLGRAQAVHEVHEVFLAQHLHWRVVIIVPRPCRDSSYGRVWDVNGEPGLSLFKCKQRRLTLTEDTEAHLHTVLCVFRGGGWGRVEGMQRYVSYYIRL